MIVSTTCKWDDRVCRWMHMVIHVEYVCVNGMCMLIFTCARKARQGKQGKARQRHHARILHHKGTHPLHTHAQNSAETRHTMQTTEIYYTCCITPSYVRVCTTDTHTMLSTTSSTTRSINMLDPLSTDRAALKRSRIPPPRNPGYYEYADRTRV